MPEAIPGYLRIRVVNRITGQELTSDLPHLHQTSITVQAMQPGNPSSSAIGSFTCHLHPPGSEGYAAAKPIYDQLDYYLRLEFYQGYSATDVGLGRLYFAGPITGIDKQSGEGAHYTLSGNSDLQWAYLSRPFPGEVLAGYGGTGPGDIVLFYEYLGTNELGAADNFNPYTAANYTSGNLPGLTSGTWSATTDEGQNVVSCATGTGAVLISKTGAAASSRDDAQMVEVSGRLKPSASATNAGRFGVGLSQSGTAVSATQFVYVTAKFNAGTARYDLDVVSGSTAAGVLHAGVTVSNGLTNVDDPEGFISLTISLCHTNGDLGELVSVVVNGQAFPTLTWPDSLSTFGVHNNLFPFLVYEIPAAGTATSYVARLTQLVRYTDIDGFGTNHPAFKLGTSGTPAFTLPPRVDAGPTFLEIWSRIATREAWYWRYTPQPYALGVRTLGTVDLSSDPGTDLGTTRKVVFSRAAGNLASLQLSANGDALAAGTAASSSSSTGGGGVAYSRDVSTMRTYGVIEDQSLGVTAPSFTEQRRMANQIVSNKLALSAAGSKTAVVLRDPDTADKWRELDKVMFHDPEMGINYLVARVIGYTFDEGSPTQTITLDQFSSDDVEVAMSARRFQQGVFQIANKFGNR